MLTHPFAVPLGSFHIRGLLTEQWVFQDVGQTHRFEKIHLQMRQQIT